MKFAITPCPNDTFSYGALVSGRIKSDFEFEFLDIEELNLAAESGKYPVTKLSFPAYLKNAARYELMDAGAALGLGTGPVLVVRKGEKFDPSKPVLVPGMNTTAAMLLKFYAGAGLDLRPAHFRGISSAVARGEADAGVLIHEGRFVFSGEGLELAADLGGFWTERTRLPVPLGCICVRRDCARLRESAESLIRESISAAFADPDSVMGFVKEKAQHLDGGVLRKHIYAFVNDYSMDISRIRGELLDGLARCAL